MKKSIRSAHMAQKSQNKAEQKQNNPQAMNAKNISVLFFLPCVILLSSSFFKTIRAGFVPDLQPLENLPLEPEIYIEEDARRGG